MYFVVVLFPSQLLQKYSTCKKRATWRHIFCGLLWLNVANCGSFIWFSWRQVAQWGEKIKIFWTTFRHNKPPIATIRFKYFFDINIVVFLKNCIQNLIFEFNTWVLIQALCFLSYKKKLKWNFLFKWKLIYILDL